MRGGPGVTSYAIPVVVVVVSVFVMTASFLYGFKVYRERSAPEQYVEINESEAGKVLSLSPGGVAGSGELRGASPRSPNQSPASVVQQEQGKTGILSLKNSSDYEAMVRVVPEGMRAGGGYFRVAPFSQMALKGVPQGRFSVFYCTGKQWDEAKKRFAVDPVYSRTSAVMPARRGSRSEWSAQVIIYHPEDPERVKASEEDFSG